MSEKHEFLVQSSDGVSSYLVEIIGSDFDVVVQCSCPAGVKRKLCKHKIRLLNNDVGILVDKLQVQALSMLLHRLKESTALIELQRYNDAQLDYDAASSSFEQAKRCLEKTLKGN